MGYSAKTHPDTQLLQHLKPAPDTPVRVSDSTETVCFFELQWSCVVFPSFHPVTNDQDALDKCPLAITNRTNNIPSVCKLHVFVTVNMEGPQRTKSFFNNCHKRTEY